MQRSYFQTLCQRSQRRTRRRLIVKSPPEKFEAYSNGPCQGIGASGEKENTPGRQRWVEKIPLDLSVVVCQCLGPEDVVRFLIVDRRTRDIGLRDEVWRFFCRARWGQSANLRVYESAKNLYLDRNGWFPRRGHHKQRPLFEVQSRRLYDTPCLTMDLRMTDEEIIAVSEAPREVGQQASVHILDLNLRVKERFDVSDATINCCDVGPNLVCTGSDDWKVRVYRRHTEDSTLECQHATGACCSYSSDGYLPTGEYRCASEVNDLRVTREDSIIVVRTHQNRHPAGLDLIPLARPDVRMSFPGGSWATRGKYIHALDGFEEGCSLSGVACTGEHPLTSAFSAMLFDFRRPAPCVLDLPVTSGLLGHQGGTMLWPLRAGRSTKVYANLLHDQDRDQRHGGIIAMVDFRQPSTTSQVRIELPDPVDDFRCFGGSIYAICSDTVELEGVSGTTCQQRLRVHRCTDSEPAVQESLCTVVEAYDSSRRSPREDLKVFSVCPRGFAVSYGEHLALGTVTAPRWPSSPEWAPRGLLAEEEPRTPPREFA